MAKTLTHSFKQHPLRSTVGLLIQVSGLLALGHLNW